MKRMMLLSALVILSALSAAAGCTPRRSATEVDSPENLKVERVEKGGKLSSGDVHRTDKPSPYFVRDGKPFCFMGSNNYYLMYKSEFAVKSVLDSAQAMNLGMLRVWAFIDRGSLDGTISNIREPGHADGTYFQYWDANTQKPKYNDGPDGLQKLDFVLSEARKRGLTLTLVLTNNWRDFGGMDQYLTWYGLKRHHEFYTDARVRQAYKDWIGHITSRVNSIDGMAYKDDPAIFAWELANEPRTINYENMDAPDGSTTDTITAWADEMSTYVKSQDPNHMVAVGDEGFLNGGRNDWTYKAPFGIDSERLTALPNIDFGTYHMYPGNWGKGHRNWGTAWIEDHIELGRRVNKPILLEEYAIRVRRQEMQKGEIVHGWRRRVAAYTKWNTLILERGGQASLFWLLSGYEAPNQLYPDYDHFTVYEGDETYQLLKPYSDRMRTRAAACTLAKGADHGAPRPFVSARKAPVVDPTIQPKPAPRERNTPELTVTDGA